MGKPIYSNCKLLSHVDALGEPERPITLILFPTNRCNMRCPWCIYYQHPRADAFKPEDELTLREMMEIIAYFKRLGLKAVQISGGGEPTLHPDFFALVDFIDAMDLEWALITNGTGMRRMKFHPLPRWIRISLDSDREHWNEVHNTGMSMEEFERGVTDYTGLFGTHVGASFVIHQSNYQYIAKAAQWARDMELKYIRYTYALTPEKRTHFDAITDIIEDQLADASMVSGIEVVYQGERLGLMESIHPQELIRCYYAMHVPVIGADGWWYPCCELSYIEKYKVYDLGNGIPRTNIDVDGWPLLNPQECPPCDMDQKNLDIRDVICARDYCTHENFL